MISQVLLFGLPRSGTTWIGKIFDSHPDTLYRHEPDSGTLNRRIELFPDVSDAQRYASIITDFTREIPDIRNPKVSGSLPVFEKEYFSFFENKWFRTAAYLAKTGARVSNKFPVLIPGYFIKGNQYMLVWKSIEMLGCMGLVMDVLRQSRGIHIVRHPCGQIASVQKGEAGNRFVGQYLAANDFEYFKLLLDTPQARDHGITLADLKEMLPVERLAYRWLFINQKAYDELKDNDRSMLVRYEDVTRDPLGVARSMLEHCGLDWHQSVEGFVMKSTGANRSAYYSVYKNPGLTANKWRRLLSVGDINRIMGIVADSPVGRLYAGDES